MYISTNFSNCKKVQNYRYCNLKKNKITNYKITDIAISKKQKKGDSKHDLLHSTGHKSLKNGSKSNKWGSLNKFRKF